MAAPTYQAAGTGSAGAAYPSSGITILTDTISTLPARNAGDLLVVHLSIRDPAYTLTTPSGWTLIYGPDASSLHQHWVFARKATNTGVEDDWISANASGSGGMYLARCYAIRDWLDTGTLSDAFEGGATTNGIDATIEVASLTTTGADRLGICLVSVSDDNALDAPTGGSGGTWVESEAEFTSTQGSDGAIGFNTVTLASAGTISGAVDTMSASDRWISRVFAIKPAASGSTQTITPSGSITPAGALVNLVDKRLSGSITPTGLLVKLVTAFWGGSITPTGALTAAKQFVLAVAGAITPTGALSNLVDKRLDGSVTPAGALQNQVSKVLAGAITPSGALANLVSKALAGSITPTGDLTTTRVIVLALSGEITPAGAIQLLVDKRFAGSLTPTGSLANLVSKFVEGSITPGGALANLVDKRLSGSITPSGLLDAVKTTVGGATTRVFRLLRGVGR